MIKLKIKDQIHLSKRLGFLISANIPILSALKMLENGSQSKKQKKILKLVSKEVSLGGTLSKGFEKAKAYGNFGIYLTEVGETSGSLGQSLSNLSQELEAKQRLRQRIIGALIYPFFISIVALAMSITLITFVFPKVLPILSGLNGELPLPTRILIFLSFASRHFGLYFLCAAASGGALISFLFKRFPKFRFKIERLELHLPYLRRFLIDYQLANLARTVGLLLKNEIVLENGLALIARHTSNIVYKKAYQRLREKAVAGERLATSMATETILFPAIFKEMVEVGEETGKLSETFIYLSELCEMELEERTKTLSGLIEPVLMIFMGLVIGGVALSIVLPIYQITANLHH